MIRSLEIRVNRTNIELWGVFYATLVKRGGSRVVIAALMDLIEMHHRAIGNDVIRGLR